MSMSDFRPRVQGLDIRCSIVCQTSKVNGIVCPQGTCVLTGNIQPQVDVIGVISFDPKTGEYSRVPYVKPTLTVFIIIEVMECDYGTQESVLEVKSTQELADARILELEAEIKDGHKPKYKYPVSWYVVDREVDGPVTT